MSEIFLIEDYRLNDKLYKKFTNKKSNKYGLYKINPLEDINNIILKHNEISYKINGEIVRELQPNSIIINISNTDIDLSNAKKIIDEQINSLFKCSDYKIVLDFGYKLGFVPLYYEEAYIDKSDFEYKIYLCLNYKSKCVSSIECVYQEINEELMIKYNSLLITSKTIPEYEGNKFNKLLRFVILIIAKYINPKITHLNSFAVNSISAFLMMNMFRNNEYDEFFSKANITTYAEVQDYFKKVADTVIIYTPIIDNYELAKASLISLIDSIPCEPKINVAAANKSKKYIHKFNTNPSDLYFKKLLYWNTINIFNKLF